MLRRALFIWLTMTAGCGSCLDDKRVPEPEPSPGPAFLTVTNDAGETQRIHIGRRPAAHGAFFDSGGSPGPGNGS